MRLVQGIGINDADYVIRPIINGRQGICPFYQKWHCMLKRCYNPTCQKRCPTYKNCKVCKAWLTFSNFKVWMINQDWKGKQLDKDIRGNGKLYSPKTCCFVEPWVNLITTDSRASRGKYPKGVTKHRNKFQARIRIDGNIIRLGIFYTPEEAYQVYIKAKREHVVNKLKYHPPYILKGILEMIERP